MLVCPHNGSTNCTQSNREENRNKKCINIYNRRRFWGQSNRLHLSFWSMCISCPYGHRYRNEHISLHHTISSYHTSYIHNIHSYYSFCSKLLNMYWIEWSNETMTKSQSYMDKLIFEELKVSRNCILIQTWGMSGIYALYSEHGAIGACCLSCIESYICMYSRIYWCYDCRPVSHIMCATNLSASNSQRAATAIATNFHTKLWEKEPPNSTLSL